ncbi:methyl-accepting chemotaxis protein [Caballeronia sordidicola]|uniref:methyl-accepting chemotaxis protein n=1 Tax=Caballeronia sordidicola TaxID=196367 RepID=UPI000A3ADB3A|nr:methyl-accepting chemotaxis protein [Caballeronia sordidicola]
MFEKLKIRTALLVLLGLFSVALWCTVYQAWSNAREATRAMEGVIRLSDERIQPLHDTERLLLTALVNMDNAYINLQRGDQVTATDYTRKASNARQEAKRVFDAARKAAGDAGADQDFARLIAAYDMYGRVLDGREEALYDVSLDAYVAATGKAESADSNFQSTLREVSTHVEADRDSFKRASAERYRTASKLALSLFAISLLLVGLYWLIVERLLLKPLRATAAHFDRIAGGDLTVAVTSLRDNEIGALMAALGRMQQGLIRTVSSIRSGTEDVYKGASNIADGNTELSERTEKQASDLEQTAATLERLAAAVKENADNTRTTNELAQRATVDAKRGGENVERIIGTMEKVADSARKISDIVSIIDGIAFQTNILALNAAVEAARAQQDGRGFAVVAAEVRSLALRSAHAAKEVKVLIEDSAVFVERGSEQVIEAGRTMQEIVDSAEKVTKTMHEILIAASEQSIAIEQVSGVVAQMDRSTQQNATLVEQTASAARSLKEQSDSLVESVSVFEI